MGGGPSQVISPNLANLQGMLVYRYRQPLFCVLLYEIVEAGLVPGFLRRWLPLVPPGDADPATLSGPVVNLGFTWAGLAALLADDGALVPAEGARLFDFGFVDQPPNHPAVAPSLGFHGQSEPRHWWDGAFDSSAVGLAVYLACDDDEQKNKALADIRASAAQSGLRELRPRSFAEGALSGHRPEGGILHFGYRDGVTTPDVDWLDRRTQGTVDFREFVMGYYNDTHPVTPKDGPWRDFARDGSFACLAWIEQDVAAFNRFLDANADLGIGESEPGFERQWLAAKLMGRWPDGSALALHPRRPPEAWDPSDAFGFAGDQAGVRCPMTAHIRVVNPRDDELTYPNQRRFPAGPPRFIRRGFSYGAPLAGDADDGVSRGIVGTFLCARVNEQFYTALRWIQQTQFAEGHHRKPYHAKMQDGLFGNRGMPGVKKRFPIARETGEALRVELVDFITYRGVSVFFLPGMNSLERLSGQPARR